MTSRTAIALLAFLVPAPLSAQQPVPFAALGAGAAWRFQVSQDNLNGEDPTRSTIELRVVEDRPERRGARLVRWEWVAPDGTNFAAGLLPTGVIIDRRGMRLNVPRSPTLPPSFARIRGRETVNRTFISSRNGMGCFEHRYQGRGEGEFYAWYLCFDESGAPRAAITQGTGSEETYANPTQLSAATPPVAAAPAATAAAGDAAFARWALEIGRAMVDAGRGRAPPARFRVPSGENEDLRSTARTAPLGRGPAELLAVTVLVNAVLSDPGWMTATAVVLPDGRVRWATVSGGRGAAERPGDATLAREAPAAVAPIQALAARLRGACDLPLVTVSDVPWATPEFSRELVGQQDRLAAVCTDARMLTGTVAPRLIFIQAIVRSGGQLHLLKSHFDWTQEGRLWVRSARMEF